MAWFDNKISVAFIKNATSAAINITQISPTDLPESLELKTTTQLGSSSWIVTNAFSKTNVEYCKSKKLKLHPNQVLSFDSQTILAFVPTIYDYILDVGNHSLTGQKLILHKNDWQQFEFVSKKLVSEINQEIEFTW
jgi:hypothetical protein